MSNADTVDNKTERRGRKRKPDAFVYFQMMMPFEMKERIQQRALELGTTSSKFMRNLITANIENIQEQ